MEEMIQPNVAVELLGQVRRERQGLTARAMGLIWMVWGLVLAAVGFGGLAGITAEARVPLWYDALTAAVPVLFGAILTRSIWQAHALQRDPRSRPLLVWVAVPVFLVTAGLLNLLHGALFYREGALVFGRIALMAAWLALVFAYLTRRRVPIGPGAVAAVALTILYAAATSISVDSSIGILVGNMSVILAVLGIYSGLGIWVFTRG